MDIERRFTLIPVETRERSGRRSIGGYAIKFNRPSNNLGGFVEVVRASFANKARGDGWPGADGSGVLCRYNHDDNALLGTTAAATLRLEVDDEGLAYEVDPPATRADVVELVERGDVRGSSFAMVTSTIEDDWSLSEQGYPLRNLISGNIADVGPVNRPAYPDSTAALKSLARKMGAELEEVRRMADGDELRRFFVRTDKPAIHKPMFGTDLLIELKAKANPA